MRRTSPILICDGDDGECYAEDDDMRAQGVTSVETSDGVTTIITNEVRAPGWISVGDDEDYCPDCVPEVMRS